MQVATDNNSSNEYLQNPDSFEASDIAPINSDKTATFLIFSLLFVLPLFFGGINYFARHLSAALIFFYLSYVIVSRPVFLPDLRVNSFLSNYLKIWAGIIFYFALQSSVYGLANFEIGTALTWFFFLAISIIVMQFVKSSDLQQNRLTSMLTWTGFIFSLIALSHWFYDTGQLFWLFQPNTESVSERARWPFVNPNHLGNFLLLSIFVVFSRIYCEYERFITLLISFAKQKEGMFKASLRSKRVHSSIFRLGMLSVFALAVLITITATLSRGSWTGLAVGTIAFLFMSRQSSKSRSGILNIVQNTLKSQKIRKSSWTILALRLVKPILVLLAVFLFFFFLNEQGGKLLEGRIEYGLLYSLDDIRWTMYKDTLHMIKDYPFLGVGLGQWGNYYPAYMSEALSGLVAGYLHSEPLQTLAELGILGSLIVLCLPIYLIFSAYTTTKIPVISLVDRMTLFATISGSIGLLVASFVEFPLRMPAIQAILAINIGLLLGITEKYKIQK